MLGKPWVPSVRSRVAAAAALVIVATVMLPLTLVGQRPAAEAPLESDLQFVFLLDGGRTISNGGEAQLEKARKQQHRPNEALLWFSQDGLDYVVRDPKAIAAMRQAWQATGESEIAVAERQAAAARPAEEREQLTIAGGRHEQTLAAVERARQASDDPEFAVAHPRSRSEAAERERALVRNLEMQMLRQQTERERLQEKQFEVFAEQYPPRIARERERPQDNATERVADLRAQLTELRRAVAMLERRLGVHDTSSVERDLAETRRLLEEVIASGRAERAR